jgi:uncharacterized protein YbjQ (UPF0145 family)
MELTTTPSMEGKKITRYCGVVAVAGVLGEKNGMRMVIE